MNFKKILALVLVIVLTASITLGVTLALLTDETEIKHNVFTAGNVSVELTEDVGGDTYGGVTERPDGGDYNLVAPGDDLTKEVKIANTGSIPAYVAVTVTVNHADKIKAAIDDVYTAEPYNYNADQMQSIYDEIFEKWAMNYAEVGGMRLTIDKTEIPVDSGSQLLQVDAVKNIGGSWESSSENWFEQDRYTSDMAENELQYTYYLYLEPGDSSVLFTGINVPEYFKSAQMDMFDGLQIDIQGAAIQAENFATAQEAFDALHKELTGVLVSGTTLSAALANAEPGSLIVLANDAETPVTIDSTVNVSDVTIDANGHNAYFAVESGAVLENVTITGLVGDGTKRHVDIAAGATVKNLTITDCQLADNSAAPYGALYVAEPTAEITITDCVFADCKYAVYGPTPIAKLTIEDCEFRNVSSWAVLLNGGDTTGAKLTIDNCIMDNCTGGIAKYLGSSQPEGAATVFTNNTLTNCAGHDGSDAKWFAIPGSTDTITVSGNTLDGAAWTPGTAQGLGK